MKVLKVINSQDFPPVLDRDPNVIYFLYNKLEIYFGQNCYTDPYLICDHDPEEPIEGMLYFILETGKVKLFYNYALSIIAEVESEEMLDLLKKQGGSYFFVNADKRYLDLQKRIITLPYRNGQWNLTVDMANNIQLTEDSAIGFNPETNCFDISATKYDYDLVFTRKYRGEETPTTKTTVDEHSIRTDVKISSEYGNIIKVFNDGIGAIISGKVPYEEYSQWKTDFYDYKASMEGYMATLEERIEHVEESISEDIITQKIHEALLEVYPLIDESLIKYETLINDIDAIIAEAEEYTDGVFEEAVEQIKQVIDSTDYWGDFG